MRVYWGLENEILLGHKASKCIIRVETCSHLSVLFSQWKWQVLNNPTNSQIKDLARRIRYRRYAVQAWYSTYYWGLWVLSFFLLHCAQGRMRLSIFFPILQPSAQKMDISLVACCQRWSLALNPTRWALPSPAPSPYPLLPSPHNGSCSFSRRTI